MSTDVRSRHGSRGRCTESRRSLPPGGSSDEEIGEARNHAEFRKKKRLQRAEKHPRVFWEDTPSPSSSSSLERVPSARERSNGRRTKTKRRSDVHVDRETHSTRHRHETREAEHVSAPLDPDETASVDRSEPKPTAEGKRARRIGPMRPEEDPSRGHQPEGYGKALLPGEGTAMAAYVQAGKRIPRRGEVGMSADEIERFEDLGYVMSGSRHARMNAVRMRKEGQVYTAEEKAAMALMNEQQRKEREQSLLTDLKKLVHKQLGGPTDETLEEERDLQ